MGDRRPAGVRLRDLHPNVRIRLAVLFVDRLVEKIVVPLLAIRFAETLGAGVAGGVLLATVVVGTLAGVLGGHWADRYGRRGVLIIAEALRALALVGLCVTEAAGFPVGSVGCLLLLTAGAGTASPAAEAALIDVTAPEHLHRVYTLSYWISNLSLSVGPLVGVVVYPGLFARTLGVLAVMSAVTTVVVYRFLRETLPASEVPASEAPGPGARRRPTILGSYGTVLRDRAFLMYFAAVAAVASLSMQPSHYIGVRLALAVPDTPTSIGPLTATLSGVDLSGIQRAQNSIVVILFAVAVGRLVAGLRAGRRFGYGLILYGVGFAIAVATARLDLIVLGTLLYSLGELVFGPSQLTILARLAPEAARSQYVAVNDLRYRIGAAVGAVSVAAVGAVPAGAMAVAYVAVAVAAIPLFRRTDREADRRVRQRTSENHVAMGVTR